MSETGSQNSISPYWFQTLKWRTSLSSSLVYFLRRSKEGKVENLPILGRSFVSDFNLDLPSSWVFLYFFETCL